MRKLFLAILLFAGTAYAQQFETIVAPETEYSPGGDFVLLLQGGAHSVDLSWTASPDGGAYNIYRATAACSTNPTFAKINSVAVGVVAFTDSGLVPNTYCYNVTTVLNGLESAPSNLAPAVVLPASATGLTAKQAS